MVTVAIAGASSGMGSTILSEILATGKHKVVVLSRSEQPSLEKEGVIVRAVDYKSIDQLTEALRGVHTVISCVWSFGPEVTTTQLALLEASKAAGVKRFVPSDWAINKYDIVDYYANKAPVWKAVQESGLEYTRFICGIWMNCWGSGAPNDEAVAGYRGPPFMIDFKNRTVSIPGDGTQKVAFTEMRDIGKFVAASLDLAQWIPDTFIVSDSLSYNELVELAEKVTGREFEKSPYPVSQIESVLKDNSNFEQVFFNQFLKLITNGDLDIEQSVGKNVPSIEMTKAENYLVKYWGGVH
ncbi:Oxidoreductase BOA1 [Cladobotryum mycophilum]|uniref:Oxidoreductase BOA1 n=1 Tax=Cladobotryum mycophilum TaxID=491253 RepID=A0ABR0SNM5_9HYPO